MGYQEMGLALGGRLDTRLPNGRCSQRNCNHAAEWSGTIRVRGLGADPNSEPLVEIRFLRICSAHVDLHLRRHVSTEAFWRVLSEALHAARLPPADRASLELEIAPL